MEDDEDDLIRFTFPDDDRKIKCSKSMLSEISPVFKTMFNETWLKESIVKLEDDVTFHQYSIFKQFLEILYELRDVYSLKIDEATAVYFYSHKYEVIETTNKIQAHLNERMEAGISKDPLSVAELNDALQFASLYGLEDFKKKLDKVKLHFNDENPVEFYNLAVEFQMDLLKEQIVQHLKIIEPKDNWTHELSNAVLKCLQKERINENHFVKFLCADCHEFWESERNIHANTVVMAVNQKKRKKTNYITPSTSSRSFFDY